MNTLATIVSLVALAVSTHMALAAHNIIGVIAYTVLALLSVCAGGYFAVHAGHISNDQ